MCGSVFSFSLLTKFPLSSAAGAIDLYPLGPSQCPRWLGLPAVGIAFYSPSRPFLACGKAEAGTHSRAGTVAANKSASLACSRKLRKLRGIRRRPGICGPVFLVAAGVVDADVVGSGFG